MSEVDVDAVLEVIWPGARMVRRGGRGRLPVLPSAARPRLVLPADRAAAVAAFTARTSPRGRTEQVRNLGMQFALRIGLGRALGRDHVELSEAHETLVDHLSGVLGQRVRAGVHLGPPRANLKPVLALIGRHGRVIAYAKVGINALTDDLVRHEARTLGGLDTGRLLPAQVPTLIHSGEWRGHPLLVMSALSLPRRAVTPTPDTLTGCVRAIHACGRVQRAPAAAVVQDGRGRLVAGLPHTPDRDALDALLDEVALAGSDSLIDLGAAHGDFAAGNVVADGAGRAWVLDWERYESAGVPLGTDLLHHEFRRLIAHADGRYDHAAGTLVREAPGLLRALGVGASAAAATAGLYVVMIASRYLQDRQAGEGRRLGAVRPWVDAARAEVVARPTSRAQEEHE